MKIGEAMVENKRNSLENKRIILKMIGFEAFLCKDRNCATYDMWYINQNKIDLIFIWLVSGAYLCVIFGLCCFASIQHLRSDKKWQRLHVWRFLIAQSFLVW